MNTVLIYGISATLIISALSLVGVFSFAFSNKFLKKITIFLVAFSTGALLGAAFFHLLPESISDGENLLPFVFLLFGIMAFYLMEKYLKWYHCHEDGECKVHTFTYMSLLGDGVHNFIDGLVIISAFNISKELGIATTIAIASHEIPQELGDFGVLIHGGFTRVKALMWNLISAFAAILGAVIGFVMITKVDNFSSFLLPFAAGGFVYIAMSDLIPELHKENKLIKSIITFLTVALGLTFMYFVKIFTE